MQIIRTEMHKHSDVTTDMRTNRPTVTRSPNGVVREKPLSVRLSPALLDKIKDLAAEDRRSASFMVCILCEEALAARERDGR